MLPLSREERYKALKKLPSELLAAYIDVQILSRAQTICTEASRVTLQTNIIDKLRALKVEAKSILEAVDELAAHPEHYVLVFEEDWREHFEGGE